MSAYREPGEADVYYEDPKPLPPRTPWPYWDTAITFTVVTVASLALGALYDFRTEHAGAHNGLTGAAMLLLGALDVMALFRKFLMWT